MRPSNRQAILVAAAAVVQREGVTSLTLDSVAAEAGLTKGGLMYHFRTRDELLQAVHDHLAAEWDADMTTAAGMSAVEADASRRLAAYVQVGTSSASRAELMFMLEGANTPAYVAPWNEVMDRWAPPLPSDGVVDDDPTVLDALVARLATDGLWMHEALTNTPISPTLRRRVTEHLISLVRQDAIE